MDGINSVTNHSAAHIHPLVTAKTRRRAFAYTLMPTEVKLRAYQQADAERRASSKNDLSAGHSVPCSTCILDLYIQQRFPFENRCSAPLRGEERTSRKIKFACAAISLLLSTVCVTQQSLFDRALVQANYRQ